jgi:amino acid transporter
VSKQTYNPVVTQVEAPPAERPHFHRSIGLISATAINMNSMCGVGPFITIPAMVSVMGGPRAMLGWILGSVVAMADGLVWAELGAAMPGAGGSYLFLREAFQYRSGKLLPFLFVWTAILSLPLILSCGVIGFYQYLGTFVPNLSPAENHVIDWPWWWPLLRCSTEGLSPFQSLTSFCGCHNRSDGGDYRCILQSF